MGAGDGEKEAAESARCHLDGLDSGQRGFGRTSDSRHHRNNSPPPAFAIPRKHVGTLAPLPLRPPSLCIRLSLHFRLDRDGTRGTAQNGRTRCPPRGSVQRSCMAPRKVDGLEATQLCVPGETCASAACHLGISDGIRTRYDTSTFSAPQADRSIAPAIGAIVFPLRVAGKSTLVDGPRLDVGSVAAGTSGMV